mmetsp:Transcript_7684/g.11562  ORF Transcript_7684/g.11562 Transcript_7684/m.11562 type:complete len:80 (-) Transcript_7684:702-941(-)
MQITVRTLDGIEFKIGMQESATIGELKATILSLRDEYDEQRIQIICSGKVLNDNLLLFKECGLDSAVKKRHEIIFRIDF